MMMLKDYWRNRLNGAEQQIYDKCLAAFSKRSEKVSCGDVNLNRMDTIYNAVCNDHPELYFLPSSMQVRQTRALFFTNTELVIDNLYNRFTIGRYENEWATLRNKLANMLSSARTEVEKEKIICEYFVRNTVYEIDNKYNQNAAAALFEHRAQCSGISKAVKMVFDAFGIDCMVITGECVSRSGGMGPHAWNIVRLNGKAYHLDVTNMIGANSPGSSSVNFVYFNYSDNDIRNTHAWDRSSAPKCDADSSADRGVASSSGVGSMVHISSAIDLKSRLKSAITVGKKQLTFISQLPVSDDELMRTIKNCCQEAAEMAHRNLAFSISITGKTVTLSW